jgi:acetyl esterase
MPHHYFCNLPDMKKLLTLPLLLLFVFAQAQGKKPNHEEFRLWVAQDIAHYQVRPEPVSRVKDTFVAVGRDSIGIRIYQPASTEPLPVIYQVHGAGWVAGDLETHDNICRYLANHLQAVVVAVNYRRAPEHKFQVAFNESYAVFKWIYANQKKLNGNGKLLLIGDSAGGQLVGSICLFNAGEKKPIPVLAQVLINPALDLSNGSATYTTYSYFVDWYLNESDNKNDVRISPSLAANVKGVPQTIIVIGEKDEIRKDGEVFHQKLLNAGVSSTLFVQPDARHLAGSWCAGAEKAKPAMDFVITELQWVATSGQLQIS